MRDAAALHAVICELQMDRPDIDAYGLPMDACYGLGQCGLSVFASKSSKLCWEADVTEWIKLISAQSNTVCEESSKKTISPEHVIEALKVSGYASAAFAADRIWLVASAIMLLWTMA